MKAPTKATASVDFTPTAGRDPSTPSRMPRSAFSISTLAFELGPALALRLRLMTIRVSNRPKARAIEIGGWSHEALQRPIGWSLPLLEGTQLANDVATIRRCGDRSRPFGLWLKHFSPEHGDGYVITSLTPRDLARWLHGIKAVFSPSMTSDLGLRAERESYWHDAERAQALLADFDWARWDLQNPVGRRAAARLRRTATRRRRALAAELRVLMAEGLEGMVGQEVPNSAVYTALVARHIEIPGLRVCECCHLVFKARRQSPASRCPACRRSPPRYKLFAVVDGGWHLSARLGPPWYHVVGGKPGRPRGAEYIGLCTECGGEFVAASARQHLCRNCGGSSGRVRRARGASGRGRQRFRFAAKDGPLSSVGVRFPNGEQGSLSAVDGVVETTDAEVAAQLDRNRSLRRLPD